MISKKRIILIVAGIIVIFFLVYNYTRIEDIDDIKEEKYISFLVTSEDERNHSLNTRTFEYSFEMQQINLKSTLPYYAQYPLSVYDMDNDCIYYSHRDESQCDQLYQYNLNTKKNIKLTNNLFAINYIFPIEDSVYLGAVYKNKRVITLLKYENGELTQLLENDDLFVQNINYNPDTHMIVFNTYSNTEAEKRFEEYDINPNRPLTGDNTIWSLDITNKDGVPHKKDVVGEGDIAYICSDEKDNIYYYQEGKHYILEGRDGLIKENAAFDELKIYNPVYITNKDVYYIKDSRSIIKYNSSTKKNETLYEISEDKSIINSAIILD